MNLSIPHDRGCLRGRSRHFQQSTDVVRASQPPRKGRMTSFSKDILAMTRERENGHLSTSRLIGYAALVPTVAGSLAGYTLGSLAVE